MRRQHLANALALSLLVTAAGCIGNDDPRQSARPNAGALAPGAEADAIEGALPRTIATWTGYLHVGAAFELPNHFDETNAATETLWSPSFQFEVLQVPRDLEVSMDWTGAAGQIMFMVITPDNDTIEGADYATDFAERGPLCMRIPADHIVPGTYEIMAHSLVAVDAHLAFSVSTLGGEGRVVDEPHTEPAAEMAAYLASYAAGGGGDSAAPEACAGR